MPVAACGAAFIMTAKLFTVTAPPLIRDIWRRPNRTIFWETFALTPGIGDSGITTDCY